MAEFGIGVVGEYAELRDSVDGGLEHKAGI